jgi:gliding motility associated protien GldN
MKSYWTFLILCMLAVFSYGQPITGWREASDLKDQPKDGIYEKSSVATKKMLDYDHLREADVFWEKRVWRIIDVREKMNKHFAYPEKPFIKTLLDAATNGDLSVYSAMDDKFTYKLADGEAKNIGVTIDTIIVVDPITLKETEKIVRNELNWSDVKRFRVKEVWYMDEETATMKVRILGIAPLVEVRDANDNFRYEQPLFWVYYPELRTILNNQEVFNPFNDANPMSWDDVFEMRYFSSHVYKESNIYDRRLQDYKTGLDILLEAQKVGDAIFQFEEDLWSR